MAKKLIHKYTFNPANDQVTIKYIYKPERLLLISNITRGVLIYAFNEDTLKFNTITYDYTNEEMTITLAYDCSAMSSTDKLQIFVEEDSMNFEPSETFVDPVSKFRVSQPENLIDTDFEYGLQSTKWETLELVKNIPTFFSRSGDSELIVSEISTINGSDIVTVVLGQDHGFLSGTPVIVQGTRNISCDGTFIVTTIIDATSFQYKAKAVQNFTGSILSDYTQVFPGQVYQGTEFDLTGIEAITTDAQSASLLTVTTEYPTGFIKGTSFYLSNSVGQINALADASLAVADNFLSVTKNVTNNVATGESGFSLGATQIYNFVGTETVYFTNSQVTINATTGIESITFSFDHGIPDNTHWLYVPGELNGVIGGLTAYTGYYVRTISANAIYLTTTLGGTTRVNLTAGGADGAVQRSAFIRAYRALSAVAASDQATFAQAHGFTSNENQPLLFFNGAMTNMNVSTTLHTPSTVYYPKTVSSATATSFTTTPGGTQIDLTTTTANALVIKVAPAVDANSLYFQSHGLSNDDVVLFTVVSGTAPGGLATNTYYKAEVVNNDRIRFKNNDTGAVINLTVAGTAVSQYRIETRTPILTNDSVLSPNHGLRDNNPVIYDAQGNTPIPGLVDNTLYYVFGATANNFKLASVSGGWKTDARSIVQSTGVNVTTNVITTAVNHGFTTGDAVQYLSLTPVGGLTNGAFYWVRSVAANTCTLHWTKAGATANNELVDLTAPITGTGTLRTAHLVDITGTSTGIHRFKATSNSASDGVYTINEIVNDNTFTLSSNNQVPLREFVIVPQVNVDLTRSAIYFQNHSMTNLTRVTYTTTGSEIGGLTDDTDYYVIRVSRDWFKLALTEAAAANDTAITLTGLGTGNHLLATAAISGEVQGPGTVSLSNGNGVVLGITTNFTAVFSPGDNLVIYQPTVTATKTITSINTTTDELTASVAHSLTTGDPVIMSATAAPGGTTNTYIYYVRVISATVVTLHPTPADATDNTNRVDITSAGTTVTLQHISSIGSTTTTVIRYVNSTTEIILRDLVTEEFSSVNYALGTALLIRADGFALHRPYDGGVELIPSANPDGQMIRQTRKYFRYQSGKGIQVSFAVNFSPTTTFESLSVSFDQDKVDKCERDLGYFIDGVGFDITLGTNYNAIFLGLAETNSLFITQQVLDTIETARDEILDLAAVDSSVAAETAVSAFFSELLDITENGRSAANAISFTNPTGATAGAIAAKDKLMANIDFITAEVNAYVEDQFAPTNHDVTKCTRDLKYAVWALAYDILYGGNSATYDSAKFFLYSYDDGAFGIIPSHIAQTVGAYERLRDIVGDIVKGISITPTTGNTETQVTSGDNATNTEETALETLAQIIVDTIDDQEVPVAVTRTVPSVTWASSELQAAKSAIDSNKSAIISSSVTTDIGYSVATGTTRFPHRMSKGLIINVSGATGSNAAVWNGERTVTKIIDAYTFQFYVTGLTTQQQAQGIVEYNVKNWSNSLLKCGLFDDQNGLYFEYDGSELSCVRRSSVLQVSGTSTFTFKSGIVNGTNTKFSSQLSVGDRIVAKGQTYLVTKISSDNLMYIIPSYRGITNSNVIITKTVDTKVPQSQWNIDPCVGTGPTGFFLDKSKIQMAYMDYSWYGAGKVRFGFKNQNGQVIYVHEFIHNNKFTEAYMRSGNLPARYEIENKGKPSYVPALAHWGTSVIMDGRFDDDKAYVFTASSLSLSITGSANLTVSARVENTGFFQIFVNNQWRSASWALTVATPSPTFNNIPTNSLVAGAGIQAGSRTRLPNDNQITPRQPYLPSVLSRTSFADQAARSLLLLDRPPQTVAGAASNYTVTLSGAATPVVYEQPLISIRLSPSVDTGTPGALGQREIINRMQLILSAVGVLSTHAAEITLRLNGQLNNNSWQRVSNPSLSQLIYHSTSDTIIGGTVVYSFRASGGTGTTARAPVITTADLGEIATLGNSILGGDNIFPDGPDVLTVVAKLVEDPSTVTTTNPFTVTSRISWSESQA
jgi:hypothetical protein